MATATNYTFAQGEDRIVQVSLTRDSLPIDLTGGNVKIWVKFIINNTAIQLYSTETIPGFGLVDLPTGVTIINVIDISVTRDQSKLFPVGNINVVVLLEETTGQDIEPKRSEFQNPSLITVTQGLAKDIATS